MDNIEYKGYTIKIKQDEDPLNPREMDNLGKMLCFHKRYDLGDKTDLKSEDFNSWQEVYNYIKKGYKAVIILPLFLYDHSGISIKIGSFVGFAQHATWDSGQVGFVYVTKEDLEKEGITKAKALKVITSEVKIYNDYISGNVYCYIIEKNGQYFYTCGGYFGDINYMIKEAKKIVDIYAKHEKDLPLQY